MLPIILINNDQCRKQFRINNPKARSNRDISLFEELANRRTCEDALMPDKYCQNYKKELIDEETFMNLTSLSRKDALEIALAQLNNMFDEQKNQCKLYQLEKKKFFS